MTTYLEFQTEKFDYTKVICLDFKTATYVIMSCILKQLNVIVVGSNGKGKSQLARVIAKSFSELVIPVGALDMGGVRTLIGDKNNQDQTHILVSDLQAFDRSRESRQKLISYLVSATDIGFLDASYDSKAINRKKPLQFIVFAVAEDLQHLFREQRKHLLDRALVIFVDRDIDLVQFNIDNDIPYELEIPVEKIKKSIPDNEKMSAELFKTLVPMPRNKISIRKREQLGKLVKGLYEIGFNGNITIYNNQEQPMDYHHYFDRIWINNHFDIEINQDEFNYWSLLLSQKESLSDNRWKNWYENLLRFKIGVNRIE